MLPGFSTMPPPQSTTRRSPAMPARTSRSASRNRSHPKRSTKEGIGPRRSSSSSSVLIRFQPTSRASFRAARLFPEAREPMRTTFGKTGLRRSPGTAHYAASPPETRTPSPARARQKPGKRLGHHLRTPDSDARKTEPGKRQRHRDPVVAVRVESRRAKGPAAFRWFDGEPVIHRDHAGAEPAPAHRREPRSGRSPCVPQVRDPANDRGTLREGRDGRERRDGVGHRTHVHRDPAEAGGAGDGHPHAVLRGFFDNLAAHPAQELREAAFPLRGLRVEAVHRDPGRAPARPPPGSSRPRSSRPRSG